MTREEIKEATTMKDVLSRYGLKVGHGGMMSCPFHGADKHPSMKVYSDSYYCFACGAHGDIFSFVQDMESCDFRQAFEILGGTYSEKRTTSSKIALMRSKARQQTRERQADRLRKKKELNSTLITTYRWILNHTEPMSDGWADAMHGLTLQLYIHEGLSEE